MLESIKCSTGGAYYLRGQWVQADADAPAALAAQAETLLNQSGGFALLDADAEEPMKNAIRAAGSEGDSVGGILETAILGLPAGVGEPYFDSVES